MKFCKDCKWFGMMTEGGSGVGCAKEVGRTDFINGGVYYQYALWIRESPDLCGPEGKWWEAKEKEGE